MRIVITILIFACCSSKADRDGENPFSEVSTTSTIIAKDRISTSQSHEALNFISMESRTIYFTRSDQAFESSTIFKSSFESGEWSPPEKLSFSNSGYDAGLAFDQEMEHAFFTSKRDPEIDSLSSDWNIWRVAKVDSGWDVPEVLPYPVNSSGMECCFTMNESGTVLFSSNRDGSWDIYEAKYSGASISNVNKLSKSINTENGEWPSHLNKTGDLLLFSSIRKTGFGGDDIYISRKVENKWQAPTILNSVINSSAFEDSPILSSDGKYLFYSSRKGTDVSNIYVVEAANFLN